MNLFSIFQIFNRIFDCFDETSEKITIQYIVCAAISTFAPHMVSDRPPTVHSLKTLHNDFKFFLEWQSYVYFTKEIEIIHTVFPRIVSALE